MLGIVVVGKDLGPFTEFISTLSRVDDFAVIQLNSGAGVFDMLGDTKIDVVVLAEELADQSGLQFALRLMKKQPLINCAIVSTLSPEQFHEETEGLGIFMQLPPQPKTQDAEKMIQVLDSIYALLR